MNIDLPVMASVYVFSTLERVVAGDNIVIDSTGIGYEVCANEDGAVWLFNPATSETSVVLTIGDNPDIWVERQVEIKR